MNWNLESLKNMTTEEQLKYMDELFERGVALIPTAKECRRDGTDEYDLASLGMSILGSLPQEVRGNHQVTLELTIIVDAVVRAAYILGRKSVRSPIAHLNGE